MINTTNESTLLKVPMSSTASNVNSKEWMGILAHDEEKEFWADVLSDKKYGLWLTITTKHDKYQYNSETYSDMLDKCIFRLNEKLFGKKFKTYKDTSRRNHLKGIAITERQTLRSQKINKHGLMQSIFNEQLHSHILIESWDAEATPKDLVAQLNRAISQVTPKLKHNGVQFFDENGVHAEPIRTSMADRKNLAKYLLKTASTKVLKEDRFAFISFLDADSLNINQVHFKRNSQ